MSRTKIVVGNWKMNLSVPESSVLLGKLSKETKVSNVDVVVCPSFIDIYSASELLKDSEIEVGAQNVYWEDSGAFTGEISANQLKGFAEYCIVGHSERRHIFDDTDKTVAKKAASLVRHGIIPIICVGESLHERMDGLTSLVIAGQIEASLSDLTSNEVAESIIAYEPVWAIGTGHVCEPKKAAEVAKKIRNLVKVLHGEKASESVRILYGGSLNEKNIAGFLAIEELDGFLVGGASLDHESFSKIIDAVDKKAGSRVIKEVVLKRKPTGKIRSTKSESLNKSKKIKYKTQKKKN